MTDRELFKHAPGVLDQVAGAMPFPVALEVRAALRERLAQPQRTHWDGCEEVHPECRKQRREWVGLTDEDRKEIERQSVYVDGAIRMTEAKLKEKNT